MRVIRGAVLCAGFALAAGPLASQSAQPFSLQVSILSTGIVANGGTINGIGVEPQLRFNGKYFSGVGKLSVGLGGQYTSHTSSNDIGITIAGGFVEPRLVIARLSTEKLSPYLAARLAVLRQSNDVASSSNGWAVGGGGGIVYALTERLNLDLGIAGLLQNFQESQTIVGRPFIKGSMSSYAAKVGINVGFGG